MVSSLAEPLDRTFAALADPTRRGLLTTLATGHRTVGELAAPLPITLVAVIKHLSVLERAGLIRRTRHGRTVVCELQPTALDDAASWIAAYRDFWHGQLDRLTDYLSEEP